MLLPTLRDPRLHLAGVIVTLQVLGQTAFDFDLSIAQILVSLLTCAVLEVAIAFRRQRVLMWPASALLTGNGVAFVLRVPGTEHGDWWSMHGWWIFAGTAAVALLSKYVIAFRGPARLQPVELRARPVLPCDRPGARRPAAFWWGPMSVWLALALVLIVGGGLAILRRLRLVVIAAGFWLTFAAGIAVLAATGHEMTAALAPRPDRRARPLVAARHLAGDPRLPLLHDHRPADDPGERRGRRVYAVSVGFLAALLLAPWTSEFAHKVAVLGALAIVCAARPLSLLRRERPCGWRRAARGVPVAARAGCGGAALWPWRSSCRRAPARPGGAAPRRRPRAARRRSVVATRPDSPRSTGDRAADRRRPRRRPRRSRPRRSRTRNRARASDGRDGAWLAELWRRIDAARGGAVEVTTYDADRIRLTARARRGPGPAAGRRDATGTSRTASYAPSGGRPGRGRAAAVVADVRAGGARRPVPRRGGSRRRRVPPRRSRPAARRSR